jgi:hypothetical protein
MTLTYLARAAVTGLACEWLIVWMLDQPTLGFIAAMLIVVFVASLQIECGLDASRLMDEDEPASKK